MANIHRAVTSVDEWKQTKDLLLIMCNNNFPPVEKKNLNHFHQSRNDVDTPDLHQKPKWKHHCYYFTVFVCISFYVVSESCCLGLGWHGGTIASAISFQSSGEEVFQPSAFLQINNANHDLLWWLQTKAANQPNDKRFSYFCNQWHFRFFLGSWL